MDRAVAAQEVSDEPPARPFWDTDLGALVPRIAAVLHILDRWLADGRQAAPDPACRLNGRLSDDRI